MQSLQLLLVPTIAFVIAGCQPTFDENRSDTGFGSGSSNNSSNGDDNTVEATRSVSLYWSAPMERVNGELLDSADIAGYEIRYRAEGDDQFERIMIDSPIVTQYHLDDLADTDYRFELATIDSNGLYSEYVLAAR